MICRQASVSCSPKTRLRGTSSYQLFNQDRVPIDVFEKGQSSLLILTRYNDTAQSFRGFFNRRIPLWEGHTRPALEKLVDDLRVGKGDRTALAAAIVTFMGNVSKGFSPSALKRIVTESSVTRSASVISTQQTPA